MKTKKYNGGVIMLNSLIPLNRSLQDRENLFDKFFNDSFFTVSVSPMKVDIKDTEAEFLK